MVRRRLLSFGVDEVEDAIEECAPSPPTAKHRPGSKRKPSLGKFHGIAPRRLPLKPLQRKATKISGIRPKSSAPIASNRPSPMHLSSATLQRDQDKVGDRSRNTDADRDTGDGRGEDGFVNVDEADDDGDDRRTTRSLAIANQSPLSLFPESSTFGGQPTTKFPLSLPSVQQTKSPFDSSAATKRLLNSKSSAHADPPLTVESAVVAFSLQREQMRSAPPADWPTFDEKGGPKQMGRYRNIRGHGRPPRTRPNRERARIHEAMVKLEMDLAELDRQALASGRRLITCEAVDKSEIVMEF